MSEHSSRAPSESGVGSRLHRGIGLALTAAVLFGISAPFAKLLLRGAAPQLLAGLLYLGSGVGLSLLWLGRGRAASQEAPLTRREAPWLGGAIAFGGVLGPFLLMAGLVRTPASSASLLLNLEGVFTALIAWFVFRENFDRRIALGMLGIVAGAVNTTIAVALGAAWPASPRAAGALLLGFLSYGVSLVLFVLALRHLGTARTGAYFSSAPFVGAAVSLVVFRDRPGLAFVAAAALMALGVWLHVTERHEHEHYHEVMEHEHA